jgi:hypothetical protein
MITNLFQAVGLFLGTIVLIDSSHDKELISFVLKIVTGFLCFVVVVSV